MKRIKPTVFALILSSFYILSVGLIEWLRGHALYFLIFLLTILIITFWRKNQNFDFYAALILLFIFSASGFIFRDIDEPTLVLRVSAIASFFLINIVLLIGPWSFLSEKIIRFYQFRRHIGVSAFLLGCTHASIVFSKYFNYSAESAFSSIFIFYGFTGLFIMFWLGLTSWDFFQKKLNNTQWSIIHTVLLVIYATVSVFFYQVQNLIKEPALPYHSLAVLTFLIVWILFAPYSIAKRLLKTRVFGWKNLHILIYIAYFSLIFHVFFGALNNQELILKSAFWFLVFFVLGSHAAGGLKRVIDNSKINSKIKSINRQYTEGEKTFIGIAKAGEFEEGRGQKFYVQNKPVAVFKNENGFIAISDVCAHQKGPLHKGKIEYGMVECPWHYWTYDGKTGCTPGKERICVPIYETRVIDGTVFVRSDIKQ